MKRRRLNNSRAAEAIHERNSALAVSTLAGHYVPCFREASVVSDETTFMMAVDGREPHRSLLLVYFDVLEPTSKERETLYGEIRRVNPNFPIVCCI